MKKMINFMISLLVLTFFSLSACRPVAQTNDGAVHVLASTTFLADITQNVAGDRLQVDSLLPFGADPHAYQAAPSDVAKIADSDLLILNGVEYEHFMEPLLENAGGKRLIVTASDSLQANIMDEDGVQIGDPHMWLDPNLVLTYVANIRDGLIQLDPEGAEIYKTNAQEYGTQLNELDVWIVTQVDQIPVERRMLVTNHEAGGYFAERYRFTVIGAVIPSLSSDAGTSAQGMAALVDLIKSSGAPAIFLGDVENTDLADQIAAETGVKVVDDLYLESLTDGPPADTYINMMKHNVSVIVKALK
jgi:ABC-type Zn uptake system ZnuABC Zn-binding protein ZnuA